MSDPKIESAEAFTSVVAGALHSGRSSTKRRENAIKCVEKRDAQIAAKARREAFQDMQEPLRAWARLLVHPPSVYEVDRFLAEALRNEGECREDC